MKNIVQLYWISNKVTSFSYISSSSFRWSILSSSSANIFSLSSWLCFFARWSMSFCKLFNFWDHVSVNDDDSGIILRRKKHSSTLNLAAEPYPLWSANIRKLAKDHKGYGSAATLNLKQPRFSSLWYRWP